MKHSARCVVVALAAAAGVLAAAAPAAAHITVDPGEAVQGGDTRVVFRVPTESQTLSTTKLEVYLSEDTPITSVRVMPVPGWTAEVTRQTLDEPVEAGQGAWITEVVSRVTWTADDEDAALTPDEFGEFPVSLGSLPEVDRLVFPSLQTYSDGSVARWIERPEDGPDLEYPAPVLTLTSAQDAAGGAAGDLPDAATEDADAEDGVTVAAAEPGSGASLWLASAGLAAGLAGLTLGGLAFARTRRWSRP